MASTFSKRILAEDSQYGFRVSLYKNVIDSKTVSYFICVASKRVGSYQSYDRALVAFREVLQRNDMDKEVVIIESYEHAAEQIEADPTRQPTIIVFPTLANLLLKNLKNKNRHKKHLDTIRVTTRCVGNEVIPTDQNLFWEWLQKTLTKMCENVKSKSALRMRTTNFKQVFRHALQAYPLAFKKWAQNFNTALANTDNHRGNHSNRVRKIENRKAYSKTEVEMILDSCRNFEEVCTAVAYLAGGFRSGEVNRLSPEKIDPQGRLDLSKIQTKTETDKRPKPSSALKAAMWQMEGKKWPELNEDIDKRRFRATCATYLLLSNYSLKDVSERLGHADITMVSKHYTKTYPDDYHKYPSIEAYLHVPKVVRFDGHAVEENAYDKFVITQLFKLAQKFMTPEELVTFKRDIILKSIRIEFDEIAEAVDF